MTLSVAPATYADVRAYTPVALRKPYVESSMVYKPLVMQVMLYGNLNVGFFINQPLQVNIDIDNDGTYIVDDDIFLVYGYGNKIEDAINDYITSLIELYKILEANVDSNPFDQKQFAYLQTFIRPISSQGHHAIQADRD